MWTKLAAWWNGLPHLAQAGITLFGGGFLGVAATPAEQWLEGQPVALCAAIAGAACAKLILVKAAKAGILAVLGLYLPSSLYKK